MAADPRPPRRIDDHELLTNLRWRWRGECAVEDDECVDWFSLHHIHKHPRDDVEANLAMVCGDGVAGHHGRIEAHEHAVCSRFGIYLMVRRLDTMEYLGRKLGGVNAVRVYLRDYYHVPF